MISSESSFKKMERRISGERLEMSLDTGLEVGSETMEVMGKNDCWSNLNRNSRRRSHKMDQNSDYRWKRRFEKTSTGYQV
jgi:hypothetical protein